MNGKYPETIRSHKHSMMCSVVGTQKLTIKQPMHDAYTHTASCMRRPRNLVRCGRPWITYEITPISIL